MLVMKDRGKTCEHIRDYFAKYYSGGGNNPVLCEQTKQFIVLLSNFEESMDMFGTMVNKSEGKRLRA